MASSAGWSLVSSARMRALDLHTIEKLSVPGEVLMESAGRALVDFVFQQARSRLARPDAEVLVVAGPGNNGGDGFVAARHLALLGVPVRVALLGVAASLRGEARSNCQRARAVGVRVESPDSLSSELPRAGVVIDALFGTGLKRVVEGAAAGFIGAINGLQAVPEVAVVAVDLPSGLDADTGQPLGHAVVADATLTIGSPKIGLALEPGRSLAGSIGVARIGIAESIPGEAVGKGPEAARLWTRSEAGQRLPERPASGHKGNFGHVLLVAGAEGMSGAAALAATAALRSGAGLVTLACPAGLRDVIEAQCTEAMTVALPETGGRALAEAGLDAALVLAADRSVVAMGPGVGEDPETRALLQGLARGVEVPLVIDADGLNAFAGSVALLRNRPAGTVLTPHPGEAARLLESDAQAVNRDRVGAARELARVSGAVILLKGPGTVVARPDGRAIINPTGGPNLATAGSGDVLTGLVAALLARDMEAGDAAALGAYVHGLAGDRIALRRGQAGMLAGELAEELPGAVQELREEGAKGVGRTGYRPETLVAFPGA